jgi:hypothetical protein
MLFRLELWHLTPGTPRGGAIDDSTGGGRATTTPLTGNRVEQFPAVPLLTNAQRLTILLPFPNVIASAPVLLFTADKGQAYRLSDWIEDGQG